MPEPSRRAIQSSQQGYFAAAYQQLTAAENATVVRSIVIFGAAVGFLQSPLSEWLLPSHTDSTDPTISL
ncbi:hypothetical protein FQN57_004533 [Myotisia sp. PD_48]|nr:hypothetical protein FQN57_004533 [Myotisia sp. PD_48]